MPNPTLTAALAAARAHYNHRNAVKIKAGYAAAFDGLSESERTTEAIAAAKAIAAYEAARLRPMSEAPRIDGSRVLAEADNGERTWIEYYNGAWGDETGGEWGVVDGDHVDAADGVLGFVRVVLPGESDAP